MLEALDARRLVPRKRCDTGNGVGLDQTGMPYIGLPTIDRRLPHSCLISQGQYRPAPGDRGYTYPKDREPLMATIGR